MATRRKGVQVNVTHIVLAILATVAFCFAAYMFFGSRPPHDRPSPPVVDGKGANDPSGRFAECVSIATRNSIKVTSEKEGDITAALKKAFTAKANALTKEEQDIAQQVLGAENIGKVIEECSGKTLPPDFSVFYASLRVHRPGERGLSNAVVRRDDKLGSCFSDPDGICTMPVVGNVQKLRFVLQHESYKLKGDAAFSVQDLRAGRAVLETERKSQQLVVSVTAEGTTLPRKIRVEAELEGGGEYYAVGCQPIEAARCKTAELMNGKATFELESDVKWLRIYDDDEKLIGQYEAPVPATIALQLGAASAVPSGAAGFAGASAVAKPKCGTQDALAGGVRRFNSWEKAGGYHVSATIQPDGRLTGVTVNPGHAGLAAFLGTIQVHPPSGCVASTVSYTHEAIVN
jgi:hypothetical protein